MGKCAGGQEFVLLMYIMELLATLIVLVVALHFTPVSEWVGHSFGLA